MKVLFRAWRFDGRVGKPSTWLVRGCLKPEALKSGWKFNGGIGKLLDRLRSNLGSAACSAGRADWAGLGGRTGHGSLMDDKKTPQDWLG